jgi:hypothetical protein
MPSKDDILAEIARLNSSNPDLNTKSFATKTLLDLNQEGENAPLVDILTYIKAPWGLNEKPYPIQEFIFKIIYGMPLDNTLKRIEVWDRTRERIIHTLTEEGFLEFLYKEDRTNLSLENHKKRWHPSLKKGDKFPYIVFRLGRRGTKTTMSQWITGYEIYKLLKRESPQAYYRFRQDQPIRITLVATGKEQAQELLAPARSAIQRSPYLKRFVESDTLNKISLATKAGRAAGLPGATSGISVQASPCSAKSLRGPANILALLEEYGAFFWELKGSNKSDKAIWTALYPSVADFKDPDTGKGDGMILIISTPQSKDTHMFKVEEEIRQKVRNGLILNIPSYWINPNLDSQVLREAFDTDRKGFEQEFDARYLEQAEEAFTLEEIKAIHKPISSISGTTLPDEAVYMGIDLGLKNDGTAITLTAINSQGKSRIVVHELYRCGLPPYEKEKILPLNKIAERIDYLWNYWSVKGGIYDQWNCAVPETYITMENGVSKKIEEVSVGDRVLTHTGQVKEVKEVFVGDVKEEKLRNLKIAGINQRLCYSRTHQFQVWSEKDQNWEWQFISDIKEGDYLRSVHFNMEEKESDPSGAMVLGYFIGHLDSLKILDNKNLRFTISSRKSNIALETILKVSELMLEEQIQFEMTPVKDSESVYIHIKNDKLVKFLKDNILEEGLIKSHWLSMNPEDSKIFVENLFKSRTSVKLSDIRIAEQLYYIVSRSGMTPWINAKQKNLNIDLDLVKSYKQESYQITLGKKSSLISTKVAPDGSLMRRVESIKEEIYTGQLFDLHVDEDFS